MFTDEQLRVIQCTISYAAEQYMSSGGEIDPAALGIKAITTLTDIYEIIKEALK